MKLSSEYLIKAIELFVGFLAGLSTWTLTADNTIFSAILSVIVGLLTTLITIMLVESFRQQNDIKLVSKTYDRLIKLILEERTRSEEKVSYILKYGVVSFADRHMPNVWRELLWNVKKSYYATNYIENEEIYDQTWADAALAIQKAKSFGEHVEIKKVFIIDTLEELESIRHTIIKQLDAGVTVKYILHATINENITLRVCKEEIESIDFGLFDDKSVFLWKLDGRSFKGGEVLFREEMVKKYRDFFKTLYLEANNINVSEFEKQ